MLSSSLNQAYRHLDEQPRAGHAKFRRGGEDDGDPARSDRGIESEGDEGGSGCGAGGHEPTTTMLATAGPGAAPLGQGPSLAYAGARVAVPGHIWLIKRPWQSGEDQCPWCSTADQR